jgi:hypothetical protein
VAQERIGLVVEIEPIGGKRKASGKGWGHELEETVPDLLESDLEVGGADGELDPFRIRTVEEDEELHRIKQNSMWSHKKYLGIQKVAVEEAIRRQLFMGPSISPTVGDIHPPIVSRRAPWFHLHPSQ